MNRALDLAVRSADHLLEAGQTDAAASILENYLFAHPPAAEVLRRLGRIRLAQGRSAEAAQLLERALACGDGSRAEASVAVPGGRTG